MKSTVNCVDDTQEIKYPCLMEGKLTNMVVLFIAPRDGTVVYTGDSIWNEGFYTNTWHMDSFTPFNGTITLENE